MHARRYGRRGGSRQAISFVHACPNPSLYAALEKDGEGVRHVQQNDVTAAVFQIGPEWPESAPVRFNQAQPHPLSIPDDVLVDAVAAGVRTRVKAWQTEPVNAFGAAGSQKNLASVSFASSGSRAFLE